MGTAEKEMKRKLIIDKAKKTATFSDEEKEFSIPIQDVRVRTDYTEFGVTHPICKVTLDFIADEIEIR